MQKRIKDIKIGDRFRKDLGDYQALAESIKEVGLLHPVVINEDNILVAGARRLEACAEILGWKEIPVTVVTMKDILKGEFHENSNRKDFTVEESVEIKRALDPLERDEAKKRQGQRTDLELPVKFTESSPQVIYEPIDSQQSRDKVAGYLGMSWRTLDKMEEIVNAAKSDPIQWGDLPDRIDDGRVSVDKAFNEIKSSKNKKEVVEKAKTTVKQIEVDLTLKLGDVQYLYEVLSEIRSTARLEGIKNKLFDVIENHK